MKCKSKIYKNITIHYADYSVFYTHVTKIKVSKEESYICCLKEIPRKQDKWIEFVPIDEPIQEIIEIPALYDLDGSKIKKITTYDWENKKEIDLTYKYVDPKEFEKGFFSKFNDFLSDFAHYMLD